MGKKFLGVFFLAIIVLSVYLFISRSQTRIVTTQLLINPSVTPRVTDPSVPPNELSAWLGYWDETKAVDSLASDSGKLKVVSPMWYRLNTNGEVVWIPDVAKKQAIMDLATLKHIQIIPTLTNEFDPDKVSSLFNDDVKTQKQIEFLVNEAVVNNYQGWDVDFEEMYEGDKQGFTDFISELANQLHNKKLTLTVTVQSKTGMTSDRPTTRSQDWPELTKSADQIRVMAYDFHDENDNPGAITPLNDLDSVLKYSVSVVPVDKLAIGLPVYGYDWVKNKGAPVQYDEASALINQNNGKLRRDPVSQELIGSYTASGQRHMLWFQDGQSVKTKINICRTYGVYQFIFWRLGGEDPSTWQF